MKRIIGEKSMMENNITNASADPGIKRKKFLRIPERISHLIGVFVFYTAVFVIITILAEGLKLFNGPDQMKSIDATTANH